MPCLSTPSQPGVSFAGQFRSVLDVEGLDAILSAIQEVWASASSAGIAAYAERQKIEMSGLRMAVLIQEMVPPIYSGVAFSRNPQTGLDETVVEAVAGRGDVLVQDGVTPERWVHKWGDWIVTPAAPAIPAAVMQEAVTQTRAAAAAFGRPVDVEWVYDGAAVYLVLMREMQLPQEPWYSNRMAREMLPGVVYPLVWSTSKLVNEAWMRLLGEVVRMDGLHAQELTRRFYSRAYFDMATFGQIFERLGMPAEVLELSMGMRLGGSQRPRMRLTPTVLARLPRGPELSVGAASIVRDTLGPPS